MATHDKEYTPPGRRNPDVLCPGFAKMRGSMVHRLRPCMTMSTPPPPRLRSIPIDGTAATVRPWLHKLTAAVTSSYLSRQGLMADPAVAVDGHR